MIAYKIRLIMKENVRRVGSSVYKVCLAVVTQRAVTADIRIHAVMINI